MSNLATIFADFNISLKGKVERRSICIFSIAYIGEKLKSINVSYF
jgi:hypothetical protein